MSGVIAAAAIGAGVGLYGASKSASATKKAASQSAQAQLDAAKMSADASAFKPYDMSTAFGNVDWLYGSPGGGSNKVFDANAYLAANPDVAASNYYSKNPEEHWLQHGINEGRANPYIEGTAANGGAVTGVKLTPSDMVKGMTTDATGNYNNYQSLLSQYFQPNLQSGGNQIYNEWQGLVAPTRQTQQSNLFDQLQAKGITGLSGYDPLTGAAANPMAGSLFSSWAGQDQQMAAGSINEYLSRLAQLQAQTDTSRNSLVGVNELPINNALNVSAQLGGRNSNAQGSAALLQGGLGAAQTTAQGQVANAANQNSFWQGLGNSISGLNFSGATAPATPASQTAMYSGNSGYDWTGGSSSGYSAPSSGYSSLFSGNSLGGVQF